MDTDSSTATSSPLTIWAGGYFNSIYRFHHTPSTDTIQGAQCVSFQHPITTYCLTEIPDESNEGSSYIAAGFVTTGSRPSVLGLTTSPVTQSFRLPTPHRPTVLQGLRPTSPSSDSRVLVGCLDGSVDIWGVPGSQCLTPAEGFCLPSGSSRRGGGRRRQPILSNLRSLAYDTNTPRKIFLGGGSRDTILPQIILFDLERGKPTQLFQTAHRMTESIFSLEYSNELSALLSSGSDGQVCLYDIRQKARQKISKPQRRFGLNRQVFSLCLDSHHLFVGCEKSRGISKRGRVLHFDLRRLIAGSQSHGQQALMECETVMTHRGHVMSIKAIGNGTYVSVPLAVISQSQARDQVRVMHHLHHQMGRNGSRNARPVKRKRKRRLTGPGASSSNSSDDEEEVEEEEQGGDQDGLVWAPRRRNRNTDPNAPRIRVWNARREICSLSFGSARAARCRSLLVQSDADMGATGPVPAATRPPTGLNRVVSDAVATATSGGIIGSETIGRIDAAAIRIEEGLLQELRGDRRNDEEEEEGEEDQDDDDEAAPVPSPPPSPPFPAIDVVRTEPEPETEPETTEDVVNPVSSSSSEEEEEEEGKFMDFDQFGDEFDLYNMTVEEEEEISKAQEQEQESSDLDDDPPPTFIEFLGETEEEEAEEEEEELLYFALTTSQGYVRFIETKTGNRINEMDIRVCPNYRCFSSAQINPSELIVASEDHNVYILNINSKEIVATLEGHTDKVYGVDAMVTSSQTTLLASGGEDRDVRIWNHESSKSVNVTRLPTCGTGAIWCMKFLRPDQPILITGSMDHATRIWDVEHEARLKVLRDHSLAVYDLTRSSDHQLSFSCSNDRTVQIYDERSWTKVGSMEKFLSPIYSLTFLQKSNQLIVPCSFGGGIFAFDIRMMVGNEEELVTVNSFDWKFEWSEEQFIMSCGEVMGKSEFVVTDFDEKCVTRWDVEENCKLGHFRWETNFVGVDGFDVGALMDTAVVKLEE